MPYQQLPISTASKLDGRRAVGEAKRTRPRTQERRGQRRRHGLEDTPLMTLMRKG
jgi:hypothetical protein